MISSTSNEDSREPPKTAGTLPHTATLVYIRNADRFSPWTIWSRNAEKR